MGRGGSCRLSYSMSNKDPFRYAPGILLIGEAEGRVSSVGKTLGRHLLRST